MKMIAKQTKTKKINAIVKDTTQKMNNLSIYKSEFDVTIRRYAEMRLQYEILSDEWYSSGCQITEEYTNKNGATNKKKTALYLAMESLRKELLDFENVLGLTPKGLKTIASNGMKIKPVSSLDKVLGNV